MLFALALGSVSTTGCLVADAPNYGPPEQRPPVINSQNVIPTLYALIVIPDDPKPIDIRVPMRSEDAGEYLWGSLWVDYGLRNPKNFGDKKIPPSSFDDLERSYETTFQWDANVTPGCHTLTAFITHDSNYDDDADLPIDSTNFDVASVTWWMNVKPDPSATGTLEGCPTAVVAP